MHYIRFGVCERYRGGVEVCNDVLSDEDYVFITKSHGSQENISHFLETNIPRSLLPDDKCRDLVFHLICHYYLIPCESEGSELPPSSICPEECSMVESTCTTAWEALRLRLEEYKFISCEDTSALLFPLPNCCTGVGIQKGFVSVYTLCIVCDFSCLCMSGRLSGWRGSAAGWDTLIQWPSGAVPEWDMGLSLFQPVG